MKTCAAVVGLMAIAVVAAVGQQASPWNGAYTEVQARRGQTLYLASCGSCHGGDLAGGDRAPALAGASFVSKWSARPLAELVGYIHAAMPLQSPGGLSRQQSADIVAFILNKGQFAAGSTEVSAGAENASKAMVSSRASVAAARIPEGYYTLEQAQRGKAAFNRNCAFCHTVDPKLYSDKDREEPLPRTFGGQFLGRIYHGRVLYPTVYHLYSKLESMPGFDTRAINAQTRADILTYMLQANGMPAGPQELTPDLGAMKSMPLNEPGFVRLFNGKDLSGIKFLIGYMCLPQPDGCGKSDPGEMVRVEGGELRCECNRMGYLYWDQKYKDFTFRYEQKFERPPNWDDADPLYFGGTGALIYIQEPHRVYPRSIEIEGRHYDLGEPVAIMGKATITYDHEARLRAGHAVGQWDAIEVVARNGQVRVSLNGVHVATVSQHDYPAGVIGLQIEGAPVAWRNLRVKAN